MVCVDSVRDISDHATVLTFQILSLLVVAHAAFGMTGLV